MRLGRLVSGALATCAPAALLLVAGSGCGEPAPGRDRPGAATVAQTATDAGGSATGASAALPLLAFDSEVVRLDARGDSLEITGTYTLLRRRAVAAALSIFYPYPEDSRLGGARTLFAEWRRVAGGDSDAGWTPLPYREVGRPPGALWSLPPGAADTLQVRTAYRQARFSTYGRYILTTTRAWGAPLRRARFEVFLPAAARAPRFSHPFVPEDGHFTFSARDFLPTEDLWVEWRQK